mgnify:CR=1 FL=1
MELNLFGIQRDNLIYNGRYRKILRRGGESCHSVVISRVFIRELGHVRYESGRGRFIQEDTQVEMKMNRI